MSILAGVRPVYYGGGQNGLYVNGTKLMPGQGSTIVDIYATAGRTALAYQGAADNAMAGAIGAAQGGIGAANAAYNNAQGQISKVNKFAGEAADSARGIGNAITNVNRTAGEVKGQAALINQSANALSPFINTLGQQGTQIYQQANPYLAAGRDILNLNTNAGGLTGAYLDALLAVDPDRYVSMAAGDVQASWANAQGQMQREMSRMGVDAGSGKYMAQMQMFSQGLAAALAGAKTRARQVGINEKLTAMQGAMGVGQQLSATGASMAGAGIQAQAQAGNLQATQGQLQAQAGGVMAQGGSLEAQAGQLGAVQANAYTAAGQQTLGAINAGLQAAGLQVQAAGQMGQVQMNAANYYAQVGQGWGQIAGRGGLMGALGA